MWNSMHCREHIKNHYSTIIGKKICPVSFNTLDVRNNCMQEMSIKRRVHSKTRISCRAMYNLSCIDVNFKSCGECKHFLGENASCKKGYFIVTVLYADRCGEYESS